MIGVMVMTNSESFVFREELVVMESITPSVAKVSVWVKLLTTTVVTPAATERSEENS